MVHLYNFIQWTEIKYIKCKDILLSISNREHHSSLRVPKWEEITFSNSQPGNTLDDISQNSYVIYKHFCWQTISHKSKSDLGFSLETHFPTTHPHVKVERVQLGHPIENKSCLYMLVEFNKRFEATLDPKKILLGLNMTPEASN